LNKIIVLQIDGVFVKLNRINVCITEDDDKLDRPLFIACNVKYLRLDEFSSLKLNSIKPKLFENERPGIIDRSYFSQISSFFFSQDEYNNENVPPINVRIDFTKGEFPPPPPMVTVKLQDRTLITTDHTVEVLTQNLEEIFTLEQKLIRQTQPVKLPPIDVHLTNVKFTLKVQKNNTNSSNRRNLFSLAFKRLLNSTSRCRDETSGKCEYRIASSSPTDQWTSYHS